jgi:hypothetical protein
VLLRTVGHQAVQVSKARHAFGNTPFPETLSVLGQHTDVVVGRGLVHANKVHRSTSIVTGHDTSPEETEAT